MTSKTILEPGEVYEAPGGYESARTVEA